MKTVEASDVVLVRSDRSGVHIGELSSHDGQTVVLLNARRLWRWRGANTLNEAAVSGVDDAWSRVSDPVPKITLLDAIEIIPVSEAASPSLTKSRWPK